MNNFTFWKNEIADMPENDENGWYDLETGLRYDASVHYKTGGKSTRWTPRDDVKENRKIARFYGGKALTGTMKQKIWAEKIRATILSSDELSDEQKIEFIGCAYFIKIAKFWIENRELSPSNFTAIKLSCEYNALNDLRDKHYDTLVRTCSTQKKDAARAEIIEQLEKNDFQLCIQYPNFDPYDCRGIFKKG